MDVQERLSNTQGQFLKSMGNDPNYEWLIFADWCEDNNKFELAAMLRWCVEHNKRPIEYAKILTNDSDVLRKSLTTKDLSKKLRQLAPRCGVYYNVLRRKGEKAGHSLKFPANDQTRQFINWCKSIGLKTAQDHSFTCGYYYRVWLIWGE